MKAYRAFSLILAVTFAAVGIIFLLVPDRVIALFDEISTSFGLATVPVTGHNFYLILAAAYMYLVTVVAALMYRNPRDRTYPVLLCHGKSASAVLSILLFAFHEPFLLYLANGIVDGGIAIAVFFVGLRRRRVA